MNHPFRKIALLETLGGLVFLAAGLGASFWDLKNASLNLCLVTNTMIAVWVIGLSVVLACFGISPRWKAFSLVTLLVTVLHLWLARHASDSYWESPVFPTTAMLDAIWHLIREIPVEQVEEQITFGGSSDAEFLPEWGHFEAIGVVLSSFWLGLLSGGLAFLLQPIEFSKRSKDIKTNGKTRID